MSGKPAFRIQALALAPLLYASCASAQAPEEPPPASETASADQSRTESRNVYAPEEFARFAPRSALDMLQHVPGFSIRAQDQDRGLGQASENVLVNGQRLASKSENIFDQLSRISADKVVRIEIVDGAALEIPGLSGQVANVVTRGGEITGRFEWRATMRPHYANPSFWGGEVSLSGSTSRLEYTLALSNRSARGGAGGPTVITNQFGELVETRTTEQALDRDNPRIAGTLQWDGPGSSSGNLNASYRQRYFDLENAEERILVNGVDRLRDYRARNRSHDYEIGADFEFGLGPGRLKLIGLERFEHGEYAETAIFDFLDDSADAGSRYASQTDTGERIARAEYGWQMLGGDWQLNAEAAFNRLDRAAQLFSLDPAGDFVRIPFPAGSGGVTEDRYESILTHGRSLGSNLTMQLGVGGEYSKLAQTGPGGLTRTFWRPKGSLSLAWAPRQGLDFSFQLARRVGQLSFGDFLARVFLDQENQNAANARLVPPQSWEAELEVRKRLGEFGSSTLKVYAHRIDDYIDIIPLPGDVEARGNIDSARLYGLELTSTFRFDRFGWRGAKLDSRIQFEDSTLRDPLTGLERPFSHHFDRQISLDLRHDIPDSDWAWGSGMTYHRVTPYVRLFEVGREYEGPIYTYAFVEHKDVFGLTLNFRVFNLNNGRAIFRRTVFDGLRDRSPVRFFEDRDLLVGPTFELSATASF